MLFIVVFIVLCALMALEYCVGSSDYSVRSSDSVGMLFVVVFIVLCALIALEYCAGSSDCGV